RIGRVVAVAGRRRTAVKVARCCEPLTDDRRPDDMSTPLAQLSIRLVAEQRLRQPGHDERVDDAEQHRGDHGHQHGNDEIPGEIHIRVHPWPQASLSVVMTTSMSLMPTNGAMMPPTP